MTNYPEISPFTVLKGCDEYIEKISNVELDTQDFSNTFTREIKS